MDGAPERMQNPGHGLAGLHSQVSRHVESKVILLNLEIDYECHLLIPFFPSRPVIPAYKHRRHFEQPRGSSSLSCTVTYSEANVWSAEFVCLFKSMAGTTICTAVAAYIKLFSCDSFLELVSIIRAGLRRMPCPKPSQGRSPK